MALAPALAPDASPARTSRAHLPLTREVDLSSYRHDRRLAVLPERAVNDALTRTWTGHDAKVRELLGRLLAQRRLLEVAMCRTREEILGSVPTMSELRSELDSEMDARQRSRDRSRAHASVTSRVDRPRRACHLHLVGRSEARPAGAPAAKASRGGGDDSGGSDSGPLPLPPAPCRVREAVDHIVSTEDPSGLTFDRLAYLLGDWPPSWQLAVWNSLPGCWFHGPGANENAQRDRLPERDLGDAA